MVAIETIIANSCSLYLKWLIYAYCIAVNANYANFAYDLPLLIYGVF